MRNLRPLAVLSLVALVALPAAGQVTPQALAKLEARHAAKPGDADASRALGIALFKLKRYPDSERALTQASTTNPKDGLTALYLGMNAEEQGNLPAARVAYTKYLAYGKTKPARNDVQTRLAALAQKELDADAKARVADERRIAGQPGDPKTLAVLPVRVTGDTQYTALGRGIAELMVADFGKLGDQLKLLERDRVQALLDEIALGRTNQMDQATVARSGRLLQASRLVTGNLNVASTQNVQLSTSIVTVSTGIPASGGAAESGALAGVFRYEKNMVIKTISALGITLNMEQRRAIDGNQPTQNLQAFLAYSRGLVALDDGRLDDAARFFDNAHALDPNFSAAAQQAANARAGQAGQSVTVSQIESRLRGSSEGQIVNAAEHGATAPALGDALGSTIQNALADVNPSGADNIGRASTSASSRDPSSSTTGNDQTVTRIGTLTIIIKRP
jgi:tetratricopeptide (TPR) repeat protein